MSTASYVSASTSALPADSTPPDLSFPALRPITSHPVIELVATPVTSVAGKTVYAFRAKDSNHVISHNGSGDTQAVSTDGRYIALHHNADQWYVYDRMTETFSTLMRRVGAAVCDRFLWSYQGNDYFDFTNNTTTLFVHRRRIADQSEVWSSPLELPRTIPGPASSPADKAVQWYTQSSAGSPIHYFRGVTEIGGLYYTSVICWNGETKSIVGSPWWIEDTAKIAGVSIAYRHHNLWSGVGGIVFSPSNSEGWQNIVFRTDYDGTGFTQLEPGDTTSSTWSHQTFNEDEDGRLIMYGPVNWSDPGIIYVDRWNQPPSGPTDRINVHTLTAASVSAALGGSFTAGQFGYAHGHLSHGQACVTLRPVSGELAVVTVDLTTGALTPVVGWHGSGDQYGGSNFIRSARPTITKGAILWHGGADSASVPVQTYIVEI